MHEKKETEQSESKQKLSLTSWLKLKLLGKDKEASPVDTQFLKDLSDIRTVGRYEIMGKIGQVGIGEG